MTTREKKGGSGLFLMELIIVLFFFLLTTAVCIQVFAKAHLISRSSLELSHAQNQCASAAEVFCGTDGSPEAFLEKFPEGTKAGSEIETFYDEDFRSCGENEAKYRMIVEWNAETANASQEKDTTPSRSSSSVSIRFLRGTDRLDETAEIYSLTVRRHIPLTAGKEAAS